MDDYENQPNVVPIIELARNAERASIGIRTTSDGREFILSESGMLIWLTERREAPTEIKGERHFHEGDSLAQYVNTFKTPDSIMLASLGQQRVRVMLDYHNPVVPMRAHHNASWTLPFSTEFGVWRAQNNKALAQAEFMRFLEENASEIVTPEAAKILEIISDFEAITTVTFKSSKRLHNGQRELIYSEKDGGAIGRATIPEKITLRMPIFLGEEAVTFSAFVRYRITDGQLVLMYEFHRIQPIIEAAFRLAVTRVAGECGMTPLYGEI